MIRVTLSERLRSARETSGSVHVVCDALHHRFALTAIVLLALFSGCGGGDDEDEAAPAPQGDSSGPTVEDPGPVHVHGLGINPKDGALFVATHTGLFRAPEGEPTAKRVADRWQDTMGFTVVGPDEFLGSGHPDGREKLPPYLGLIRSRDAGKTWREVSLMGKSDFHVLEAAGSRVYGFGSNYETRSPEFRVSDDGGKSWDKRTPPGGIISLAIAPGDPEEVVAAVEGGSVPNGLYASDDAARRWRPLSDKVGLIVWVEDALFLVDGEGVVARSGDGGRSVDEVGEIGGHPAAFEAAGGDLLAALHDGTVKLSSDGGQSWTVRSEPKATVTQ